MREVNDEEQDKSASKRKSI